MSIAGRPDLLKPQTVIVCGFFSPASEWLIREMSPENTDEANELLRLIPTELDQLVSDDDWLVARLGILAFGTEFNIPMSTAQPRIARSVFM